MFVRSQNGSTNATAISHKPGKRTISFLTSIVNRKIKKCVRTVACIAVYVFFTVLPNINDDRRIIAGSMDNLPKEKSSIVRIFLSSTFSGLAIYHCLTKKSPSEQFY